MFRQRIEGNGGVASTVYSRDVMALTASDQIDCYANDVWSATSGQGETNWQG